MDLLERRVDLPVRRLPTNLANEQWAEENGVTLELMIETMDHWKHDYIWRSEEALLNQMPQFSTSIEIDDFGPLDIHFVHSLSTAPKTINPIPLLFLHGWPDSFNEISKALPILNIKGFNVVATSLPGFGFSSCPDKAGFKIRRIAHVMQKLMARLSYDTFIVQGGDWGAMIAWNMALYHPDSVALLHVNLLSMKKPDFKTEPSYTDFEKRSLAQHEHFNSEEFAYYMVQNTKPRTLGYALHDSPVGMLAWMADKLITWSDSYPWSPNELITWTLLHYFPGPTNAFQIYRENSATQMGSGPKASDYVHTPTYVSAFAKEAEMVPRSWAETRANICGWREHESGGHFAAHEEPDLFAKDLEELFIPATNAIKVKDNIDAIRMTDQKLRAKGPSNEH